MRQMMSKSQRMEESFVNKQEQLYTTSSCTSQNAPGSTTDTLYTIERIIKQRVHRGEKTVLC